MNASNSLASPKLLYTDLENSTIQKQRKELQLLITELNDRDKELNDMVTVHQRQLLAWENDRQRIFTLEQKCTRLETELQRRNEISRSLTKRIKLLEAQQQDRRTTLENTQEELQKVSLRASEASNYCQDLEEKNQSLNDSVLELSAHVGRLQAREQELSTLLRLKDNDIIEATNHITEFTSRFKDLEGALRETRHREASTIKEVEELKARLRRLKTEVSKLKDDLGQKSVESNDQREEIIRLKQDGQYLQAELAFTGEREKRKDQLLQLAKSKQDRTETELQNLRQIYLKQQHDLQFLYLTLECSYENTDAQVDNSFGPLDIKSLVSHERERFVERQLHSDFSSDLKVPQMQSTLKDSGNLRSLVSASTLHKQPCSPTTKLQRLLKESRQMVADLELDTLLSGPSCSTSKLHLTESALDTNFSKIENLDAKTENLDTSW